MNSNLKAFLRADASNVIGGGHVFRCLTLADALATCGWQCTFACKTGTLEAVPALGRSQHDIVELRGSDESNFLQVLQTSGADLLIIDHYGLDVKLETACRPWVHRILALDDGLGRNHDCDILLDQNLGANPSVYLGRVPNNCKLLLGPKFALLRPQFSMARDKALLRNLTEHRAQRLLISLGASDLGQLTNRIVSATTGLPIQIDVVLGGSASRQGPILSSLSSRLGLSVNIHVDVSDMAALMSSADIAIGAGGSTSWERCCLGLPSLIIVLADNQRNIAASLDHAGAALDLGKIEDLDDQKLTGAIRTLYRDERLRSTMAERAAVICDGYGVMRVMEILNGV